MPEPPQIIGSYNSVSPTALVVNELGAIGSLLADSLLAFGCRIYFFGNKKTDEILHLQGKNNFEQIDNLDRVYEAPTLNYIFYLSTLQKKQLVELAKKAKEKGAKFLLAFSGSLTDAEKIVKEISDTGVDIRVCLFDEIYGPRLSEGFFPPIIKKAVLGEKISITRDQVLGIYLVYSSDFISGINRAMFSPDTNNKILKVAGDLVTPLAFLAEIEKKFKKMPPVEFVPVQEKETEKHFDLGEDFGWKPEVSLVEGINKTTLWLERKKEEKISDSKTEKEVFSSSGQNSHVIKKIIFGVSIFISLACLFFLLPSGIIWYKLNLAERQFSLTKKYLDENNLVMVSESLSNAQGNFLQAKKTFDISAPFYSLIGLESSVWQAEPMLNGSLDFLQSTNSFLKAFDIFKLIFSTGIKGGEIDYLSEIKKADLLLEEAYFDISLAWGQLKDRWGDLETAKLLKLEKYFAEGQILVPQLRKQILELKAVLNNFSGIVGIDGERNYLVILQNNLELWPTGGKIGAYGILSFSKGRLINFDFQDISVADAQLKGEVEPPAKIKDFLGEKKWYLRDANWDPDFPVSAQKIEWFFEKETGRQVDGVIAVNLNTVRKILTVTGEIETPFLPGKINAQNIFEKAAYYSAGDFPGSTKKNDFFGELSNLLMGKITTTEVTTEARFLISILESLKNKDLLFYFNNPSLAKLANSLGWNGSILKDFPCEKLIQYCLEDYLFINETNLGGNRTNLFLKRSLRHQVVLAGDGKLAHNLKIDYQNLSLTETWPQGRYKNYLRIIVPEGSQLGSVMLNDPVDPGYWVQLPLKSIDFEKNSGKESFGFLVEIPAKSNRTVEVRYLSNFQIDFKKSFSYLLYNQKQSGWEDVPYSFIFSFPGKIKPMKILPKGNLNNGKEIVINESFSADKVFRIDFSY